MLLVLPMIIWGAISNSIFGSIFIPLMTRTMDTSWDDDTQNQKALFAMVLLGVGEIFGG
jgi:hypothetical protein